VKCISDLINPNKLMKLNPLPLKLANGILVPKGDSFIYESSTSTLLEIQMTTDNLQLTKIVEDSLCSAEFIKLVGSYSSVSGATLFFQAKTDHGSSVAILECPDAGFFLPVHVTNQTQTYQPHVKFDTPEVDMQCALKCARNTVPMNIKGHLHYLSNIDVRDHHMAVSYEPVDTRSGFHFLSITGFGWYTWMRRGIIALVLILITIISVYISFQMILRKMI
jgi:hypothetical protein